MNRNLSFFGLWTSRPTDDRRQRWRLHPPNVMLRMEPLEVREVLSSISDAAFPLLHDRVVEHQTSFFVQKDADSGENAGFPSGFFGELGRIQLDTACVDDVLAADGCSDDPNALDRVRGTVTRVTLGPFSQSPGFGGINWEEPERWGVTRAGRGYDLRGATHLVLDVRSPDGVGRVQFGVGERVTQFMSIPTTWTELRISINSLRLPESGVVSPPDLSNVHVLLTVVSNEANDGPNGVTVLVDNVRFEPVPASRQMALSFPRGNDSFGVVPVVNPSAGQPIPPDQAIRNLTTTYESSLTALALLHRGQPSDLSDARHILDTFVYALDHDNDGLRLPQTTLPDGSSGRGLHDAYINGDVDLFNAQRAGPLDGKQGQIRFAGFSGGTQLCGPTGYCVVLDGGFGGNNAFAIMALADGYQRLGDPRYLDAARTIGRWTIGNLMDNSGTGFGGYFLGYPSEGAPKVLLLGKSAENNADIFSAFQRLAAIERSLGNDAAATFWTEHAYVAGDFVMEMIDPVVGRFNVGTLSDGPNGPPTGPGLEPNGTRRGNDIVNTADFIDSTTFPLLSLTSDTRYRDQLDWRRPLDYAIATFAQTVTAGGQEYRGFNIVPRPTPGANRPDAGPNGVAIEFTAQIVEAMKVADALYGESRYASAITSYLDQIRRAQTSAPFGDGRGLVASIVDGVESQPPVNQCVSTPFQCIPSRVGSAATTWAIFADKGVNIFTVPSLTVDAAPTVSGISLVHSTNGRNVRRIVIAFSEELAPAGSTDASNYRLCRRTGLRCVPVAIRTIAYDAAVKSVTLTLAIPIPVRRLAKYELTVFGSGTLTDLAQNRLDGDSDGNPGGDFVRMLA